MVRKTFVAASALALLAVAPLAQADHDRYWRDPQVRVGIDLIWGGDRWYPAHPGYGSGWARAPSYWYPPRHYYGPPGHWKPPGRGHWKRHHSHGPRGGWDRRDWDRRDWDRRDGNRRWRDRD